MENDNSTKVCQDQLLKASQDELLKASQDESFALDDLKEEFAYLEKNSEGKWIRHTIHLHKILEFSRLSEFINKPLDIIMDEFNKLKVRFVLDGTGYSSMEDYLEKNQNGTRLVLEQDQNKTRSDFFGLYNSQLEKNEKSFENFIKFLNQGNSIEERAKSYNTEMYSTKKELEENEFYFIVKTPQSPEQISLGKRSAILYKIISNITWDAFHSYASHSADIIALMNNIQSHLFQQSHGTILNHSQENTGAPQGLYNLKTYKFIDNITQKEWIIDSVKSEDEISGMILDNYNKTFSSFLSENLKTSGEDLYSFKNITDAQKLNKFNLIDLTQDDVRAFKNENLSYEMKERDVYEVLIQGDYSVILDIINSEDFKIKEKTLFKYLEENAKILFYKKNIEKQDFKIKKFFNNSESLTKYFVITSISDEKYGGVFQLFNMTDNYINNKDELFEDSLFNFYKKTNVNKIALEISINNNKVKFQFEDGVNLDQTSFSSFEEAKNYFLNKNMFVLAGKKYLITIKNDYDNDTFYIYNIYYNSPEDDFNLLITDIISKNNYYNNFESSLAEKNIEFGKQVVYTKDAIKQNYYLLGDSQIQKVKEYAYRFLHFSDNNDYPLHAPKVGCIYTSADSKQFSEIFSDNKEKYKEWSNIINRLKEDKFKNKYLGQYSIAGVPYSGLYDLINAPADSSSFSFYYKGLIKDDKDFIKTILFYATSEKKFYSIKVFTPLGIVEKDYFKKDQIFNGCNSINDIKINSLDNKLSYYIKDSSWITELGSLESFKTNKEYQKLRTVFKGLGYENIYNEKYFYGNGVKNLKDLLISNLTEYISTKYISTDIEKPDLSQFYLNRVLASEEEFFQAVKDVVLGAYNFLSDSCNARKIFFIGGVSILNKEVAEKYKGEYYDPYFTGGDVNKIKRKLEYLYFGQQGWNYWPYEYHNNIMTFDLYGTTMPEPVFKETYLKNKNSSNKSNYFFESLGYENKLPYCFNLGMKYWFESGAQSGKNIDIYKKENVYYFDKDAKTFYKIDKDYTFTTYDSGYESGLMQCPNINKVREYSLASYGFKFFGIADEPTSMQDISKKVSYSPDTVCYSYKEKSTIKDVYIKYFLFSFVELIASGLSTAINIEKIYAFPIDSDLILSISKEEKTQDSLQEKLMTALELKDSEFLDKFRFFSEDEMKEIKLGAKVLYSDQSDFKRSSDEKFSLTKAQLDEILERIS